STSLHADVEALAAPALDGRAAGTAGDRAARALIIERFRCLGLEPGGDDGGWEQRVGDTANVVGLLRGTGPDIVVVGAHPDHLGDGRLGANGGASGVAALLAIAQDAAARGAPRRTLAFVAFGAEEQGLVGSTTFAEHAPLERVVAMVNLDMVGSYASKHVVYAFGALAGLPARAILDRLAHPGLRVAAGGHSVR